MLSSCVVSLKHVRLRLHLHCAAAHIAHKPTHKSLGTCYSSFVANNLHTTSSETSSVGGSDPSPSSKVSRDIPPESSDGIGEGDPSPSLIASRDRLSGFSGDIGVQKAMTQTLRGRLTKRMMDAAHKGGLAQCLEFAINMKTSGIVPDLHVYAALMTAAASYGLWLDAWAILDDMIAGDVQPDVNIFNSLLKAQQGCNSQYMWLAFNKMNELGVMPNASTYSLIITRFLHHGNLEAAIQYFFVMKSRGFILDLETAQDIVSLAAQLGHPRLALDIVKWFEGNNVRRFDHTVWMKCLIAAAQDFYLDGVSLCWEKLIYGFNFRPSEGVYMATLNTAARNGSSDLATDVLSVMKFGGIEWQEHHFGPLVEAFCRQKRYKDAFQALEVMRSRDIQPVIETLSGMSDTLTDAEAVDSAWAVIDELYMEGSKIELVALQVLMKASINVGDLQRAVAAYKNLIDYGIMADLVTFNILIDGCVMAGHRKLGDSLLSDMKAATITPNRQTFESFILLCLTQDDYEDTFFYLEEMKAAGFTPSYTVYKGIIEKCIASHDSRFKVAVADMNSHGHKPTKSLQRLVRQALNSELTKDGPIHNEPITVDGDARRFIETGGIEGATELPKEYLTQ